MKIKVKKKKVSSATDPSSSNFRIKIPKKMEENLPAGVSREMSPLFDFYKSPSRLAGSVLRYLQLLNAILQVTELKKKSNTHVKIVDLGCGNGEMYQFLRDTVIAKGSRIDYQGYEIDPWKLENARKFYGKNGTRFHEADLTKLNIPESDVILCTEVLEHLNLENGKSLLKRIYSRCRYFICTCPCPNLRRENKWHLHEYTDEELRGYLLKYEFKILHFSYLNSKYNARVDGKFNHPEIARAFKGMQNESELKGNVNFIIAKGMK